MCSEEGGVEYRMDNTEYKIENTEYRIENTEYSKEVEKVESFQDRKTVHTHLLSNLLCSEECGVEYRLQSTPIGKSLEKFLFIRRIE